MAIELWWWLKPLFETSLVTFILFLVFAWLFEETRTCSLIMLIIAIAPLAVCFVSVFAWFLCNLMVEIWR